MRTKKVRWISLALPAAGIAGMALVALLSAPRRAQADNNSEEAYILRGFQIAPVPLNLNGKNAALVGYGSYLVNAVGDCNGCHNSGQPPNLNYVPGENPYLFAPGSNLPQMKKVNPATYLGGGQSFFTVDGGDPSPIDPEIISRNLTPDKTGRGVGGDTLAAFIKTIRTGVDQDHAHPILPAPFDPNLLQVMPWPTFALMSDHDLAAMYEYLSAVPCLEGGPGEPPSRCK
jgi:hypothetical protein